MSNETEIVKSSFFEEISQLLQVGVVLTFLYSLFVDALNKVYFLLSPSEYDSTDVLTLTPVLPPIVDIPIKLPLIVDIPIVIFIIKCFWVVVITYYIAFWICHLEWVRKLVLVRECKYVGFWRLYCYYKLIIVYILRIVCWPVFRWLIIIVGLVCMFAGSIVIFI